MFVRSPILVPPRVLHHESDRPLAVSTQTVHRLQYLSLGTTHPCSYLPPCTLPIPLPHPLALVGSVSTECPNSKLTLGRTPSSPLILLVLKSYQLYLLNIHFLCLQALLR